MLITVAFVNWRDKMKDKLDGKNNNQLNMSQVIETAVFDEEKMDLLFEQISDNIHKYRVLHGLSFDQLSVLSNISKGQLYKIEKKQTNAGLSSCIKIAVALQISLDCLIPIEQKSGKKRSLGNKVDEIMKFSSPVMKNTLLKFCYDLVGAESRLENRKESNKKEFK